MAIAVSAVTYLDRFSVTPGQGGQVSAVAASVGTWPTGPAVAATANTTGVAVLGGGWQYVGVTPVSVSEQATAALTVGVAGVEASVAADGNTTGTAADGLGVAGGNASATTGTPLETSTSLLTSTSLETQG